MFDTEEKAQRRESYEDGCRNWNFAAMSQEMPTATRSWERQRTDSPLKPSEKAWPY